MSPTLRRSQVLIFSNMASIYKAQLRTYWDPSPLFKISNSLYYKNSQFVLKTYRSSTSFNFQVNLSKKFNENIKDDLNSVQDPLRSSGTRYRYKYNDQKTILVPTRDPWKRNRKSAKKRIANPRKRNFYQLSDKVIRKIRISFGAAWDRRKCPVPPADPDIQSYASQPNSKQTL
jgi:hypothetical protein